MFRGTGNAGFALARYKTDGTLDLSFDGDGKQTLDFGGQIDWAAQPRGYVVGGELPRSQSA